MRGASLKSVQKQLGHTTLEMTERYAHLSNQFQREEVNRNRLKLNQKVGRGDWI